MRVIRHSLRLRSPSLALGRALLCVVASLVWMTPVSASDFPDRSVTIVVPYSPGGVTDLYARAIAARLQERWGQTVLVDNKGGGGTVIGTQHAARAQPDGYTLLLTSYGFTSSQVLSKNLPYDPASLTPLILLGQSYNVLVLNPSVKANTLPEVIALAKSAPGALKLASSGNGSSPHIGAEFFMALIGADVMHVPYKGTAPALNGVFGGQVDGIFDGISAMAHVRAGKLKAIAVTAPQRHPQAPEVPTFRELGLDLVSGSWFGFFVPPGTPEPVQRQLFAALRAAIDDPVTRAQISKGGLRFTSMDQPQFKAFLADEVRRLRELAGRNGAHLSAD